MPIYEYVCTACGHPLEVMHSFTAPGPERCERCGAPMRKALSTPAIVFKGSGWAKKDHRDKVHAASKPAPGSDAAGAAEGTGAAGPAGAGEAAPASTGGTAQGAVPAASATAAATPSTTPTPTPARSTTPGAA